MSGTGQWDPCDQRIGSLDPEVTCASWVYSLWNTQSWEATEYEAEEADRHTVSEAGKSVVV